MLWRGVEIEPQWVVLAVLVIALALGRGREFVTDWLPFLLLFFAYEVMRGFAAKTGFAPHDLGRIELALFRGTLPTEFMQQHLYRPAVISPWDWIAIGLYFMHFVLPVVVGFVFWISSREHYWHYVAALLLLCFLAFVTYLFFPSTPPWLQFPHAVHKISNETVSKWGVQYLESPIYGALGRFDPNLYAAFPSLHAAFPTLAAVYAWRRYRPLAIFLLVWSAAVWWAIVYLGEHYVVDALCGLVYVAVATLLVEWAFRLRPRPMPATPAS
jgi:membrane-associated phospholipid phosphatase